LIGKTFGLKNEGRSKAEENSMCEDGSESIPSRAPTGRVTLLRSWKRLGQLNKEEEDKHLQQAA